MGLFDFFKKEKPKGQGLIYAPTMSGISPFYTDFGNSIYASDIVLAAIQRKAREFKKITPLHIRNQKNQTTVVSDSDISRVLKNPNELMTAADFLEKCVIILELTDNCFIYPQYEKTQSGEKKLKGLYPLRPSTVDFLVNKSGKYFVEMSFNNGFKSVFKYSEIIHWRKNFYSDYFGGSQMFDEKRNLLKELSEYDKLKQSIAKAVAVSCNVNGVAKINSYESDEKLEKWRIEFEKHLANNESGILFTDLSADYTDLPHNVKIVDAETLKFYQQNIIRATGTSLPMLNNDYTKAQKEAYYDTAIEPDKISLEQAMNKILVSDRQDSFGNEIKLYTSDIEFMTVEEKLTFAKIYAPTGSISKNELRELFGKFPIEGGENFPRGYDYLDEGDTTNE